MDVSGAVEQNIDGSNAGGKREDSVGRADIERLQFPRQSIEFPGVKIGRNNAAALTGKSDGGGAADTGSSRGDECGLSL